MDLEGGCPLVDYSIEFGPYEKSGQNIEGLDMSKHSEVVWDQQQALEYVGGDKELLKDLMTLFLQRKDILLKAVESFNTIGKAGNLL